uniref:TRASH domain-containing protein n=1 Tax=Periophthalmus magnuspinnatus TaxID=409849 RepID=A0A3B4BJ82_9GOBI
VQVKDEPLDEEYDRALTSCTAVKDEEEFPKNDLQIGAVFSVPPEKPAQPPPGHMSCSRCKKALVKGQTAFQRKGCPSVYCSTSCLTANLKKTDRICHQCRKVIERPQEVIVCPDALGAVKNFCSQKLYLLHFCVLLFFGIFFFQSKHEVSLCGILHKLCSDDCFETFRTTNKLTMSGCVQCGSFFSTKPLLLILSDGITSHNAMYFCLTKSFCQKNPSSPFCTMCRSHRPMSEMVENTNPDNSVNLFCSTSCIMAYKVQTVSSSGVRLSCDTCMKITVPSYHLAMSDTSIRNFCSLPCVLSFQEKFKKQPTTNVFTKLPTAGLGQQLPIAPQPISTISLPPLPKHLYCRQCDTKVAMKPEDKMVFFCGQNCLLDFKTSNFLFNVCDYCKVEKVTKEVKRIMSKTCNFCSDGCKLLYRHDLTKSWGKHCHSCSFCHSVSKKVLTAHYGTAEEQFCSELCRSNYTMLFCHVSLSVITATSAPAPPTKILKNKALLCKPLVQNKGISCKTQTTDSGIQTDKCKPDILILPVPVPVYVPVPMAMYSQCTPHPLGLPVPLPVPMFLPVAMDNAEKIVETIQEIKQKIPPDPFEAELILMAEMVAEDTEEKPKEKPPERRTSRTNAPAHDDRTSTYSDDLDTDDLTSFLNNWEETDAGLRTPSRPFTNDKLTPLIDIPVGTPNVQYHDNRTYSPPPMDLEADQTIGKEPINIFKWLYLRMIVMFFHLFFYFKGRKPKRYAKSPEPEVPSAPLHTELTLKSEYGLNAWKHWVQWRRNQPQLQKLRIGSRPFELREDVLQCTTAELSLCLCFFISEIKRPNGESYSPDSLYSLASFRRCYFLRFSADFTTMLGDFKPIITSSGYVHSRVEESFMWECKQLGAYSPIVLLNTLLFFCCKHFGFRTVAQHRQLSFAHVMRCTKTDPSNNKTTFLRFYPPVPLHMPPTADAPAAKKRKGEDPTEEVLEMPENAENPLRCPVRLYEFYLSKCSESVKQRTNLFYLLPERCCVPNSPLWFSSTPLDDATMESMLVRILSMRELHPKFSSNHGNNNFDALDDKPYLPEEDSD